MGKFIRIKSKKGKKTILRLLFVKKFFDRKSLFLLFLQTDSSEYKLRRMFNMKLFRTLSGQTYLPGAEQSQRKSVMAESVLKS